MDKVLKRLIFDLSIKLPNLEFKKPKLNVQNPLVKNEKKPQSLKDVYNITIQDFLDVDDKMAKSLKNTFFVSHYLNLEALIVNEIVIKGEINILEVPAFMFSGVDPDWFDIKSFVKSLKKLPKNFNFKADWEGYFEEISPPYEHVYKSPEFISKETPYWLTRAGSNDHEGWERETELMEREKRNYQEGNTNEDGDWVNH
tara:strand:- start:1290 stop:1886 length:597 start_codon:yes stop_codon:yes gene_type:complete